MKVTNTVVGKVQVLSLIAICALAPYLYSQTDPDCRQSGVCLMDAMTPGGQVLICKGEDPKPYPPENGLGNNDPYWLGGGDMCGTWYSGEKDLGIPCGGGIATECAEGRLPDALGATGNRRANG